MVIGHYSEAFEQFWNLYPRKIGKRAAWLAWQRQVKRDLLENPITETIIVALTRQVDGGHFSADKSFIPHPRTWLHQGRWEDEIVPRESKAGMAAPEKGKYDEFC